MTREGALNVLINVAPLLRDGTRFFKQEHEEQFHKAYEMAIKALEQPEPCEDAVSMIKNASFTGSDGLDYVETLVALDALKLANSSSAQPEPSEIARDIATIIENEKDMRVVLKNSEPCEDTCLDVLKRWRHD